MICTSAISSIDSLLAKFKGVEKEGSTALQIYFRQAISLFVAIDAAPNPLPVPTHSRSAKGYKANKENFPDKPAKIVVPPVPLAPTLICARKQSPTSKTILTSKPIAIENSWAIIVRNGHKKARAFVVETPSYGQIVSKEQNKPSAPKKVTSTPCRLNMSESFGRKQQPSKFMQDNRLFLPLPPDHDWGKLSPAGIREDVVKKMAISPVLIRQIKTVRSGFALSPSKPYARETLLQAANGIFLTDAKLESAEKLVALFIPTVPASLYTDYGRVLVTPDVLTDGIERISSVRPSAVKLFGTLN